MIRRIDRTALTIFVFLFCFTRPPFPLFLVSQDQLRIAKHLLLSSPPGQFDLILEDLRNVIISPSSLLTAEWARNVRNEYMERNNYLPKDATQTDSSNRFCNMLKDAILHSNGDISSASTSTTITSACSVTCSDLNDREFAIVGSRENNNNLKNCYSGSWTGRYRAIRSTDDGCKCTLDGTAHIKAHVFEHGNIQIESKYDFAPKLIHAQSSTDDEASLCQCIANQIREWEEEILHSLREMYSKTGDSMLKSMRRVMPVTRTRMEWSLQPHRMVQNLKQDK